MQIQLVSGSLSLEGSLIDNQTAACIFNNLPFNAHVNTWGQEIYFSLPFSCPPGELTEEVEVGTIAYWPEGNSLCVFFGRTPASSDERPRPASGVVLLGEITADAASLKSLKSGDKITVNRKTPDK